MTNSSGKVKIIESLSAGWEVKDELGRVYRQFRGYKGASNWAMRHSKYPGQYLPHRIEKCP